MLEDNLYRFGETANTEHNIAIFTHNWKVEGAKPIFICGQELYCHDFTKDLVLYEEQTNECVKLTNTFTPYIAEFSDNYTFHGWKNLTLNFCHKYPLSVCMTKKGIVCIIAW